MKTQRPKRLDVQQYFELIEMVEEYMDYLFEDEDACEDTVGDYDSRIFEKAVEAIYGPKVWDSINKRIDEL